MEKIQTIGTIMNEKETFKMNTSNLDLNQENLSKLWYKYKNVKEISKIIGISIVNSTVLTKMIMPYILNEIVLFCKDESLNYYQIARKIGIGNKALRNWMKKQNLEEKYNLPVRNSIKPTSRLYDNDILAKEYFSLKGINIVKQRLKSSSQTLKTKLIKLGFETDGKIINRTKVQKHFKKNGFTFNFSKEIKELIYGTLLGDGSIQFVNNRSVVNYSIDDYKNSIANLKYLSSLSIETIKNSNLNNLIDMYNKSAKTVSDFPTASFCYSANVKEFSWITYIGNEFEKYNLTSNRYFSEGRESEIYGRKTKSGNIYTIQTSDSVEIAKVAMDWYILDKIQKYEKKVPKSLKSITPNILFAWFLGDGSNNRGEIELSTHSFSKDESEYLISLLNKVGIEAKLRRKLDKRNETLYTFIVINPSKYNSFMNYLNLTNPEMLNIGKTIFPWKFDRNLRFKDWKSSFS